VSARRSLAGAFAAPPTRSAGLLELLPPRSAQPVEASPRPAEPGPPQHRTEPVEVEEVVEPPAGHGTWYTRRDRTCAEPTTTPGPATSSAEDVVRSVAVYLPPPLLARLRRAARTEDLTYADLLVRAADNHADAVAARFTPQRPARATTGGMPTRSPARRTEPGMQTQLRLDGHQIAWLDEQTRRLGAPSRTALVVALLDADLP
jgi:hypothetical protein